MKKKLFTLYILQAILLGGLLWSGVSSQRAGGRDETQTPVSEAVEESLDELCEEEISEHLAGALIGSIFIEKARAGTPLLRRQTLDRSNAPWLSFCAVIWPIPLRI